MGCKKTTLHLCTRLHDKYIFLSLLYQWASWLAVKHSSTTALTKEFATTWLHELVPAKHGEYKSIGWPQ